MIPHASLRLQMQRLSDPSLPVWRRWAPLWHSVAYVTTLGVALVVLADAPTWQTRILLAGGLLLWLGWYTLCLRAAPAWWGRRAAPTVGCLIIGWAIWVGLCWLATPCTLLLLALYIQLFLFASLALKLTLSLVLAALTVGVEFLLNGGWSAEYLVPLGVSGLCILLALFVSLVIKQNVTQQRLITTLNTTRQELAASERRAGIIEERQRLAYEIHDTLAQGFTSIALHLEAADALLGDDEAAARQHLTQARQTARENLTDARRLMWALQLESPGQATLAEALDALASRWAREANVTAFVTTTGASFDVRPEYADMLLRVAREALANVRKHAHASQVTLTLSYMEASITLDVQDDGMGFVCGGTSQRAQTIEAAEQAGGLGLQSLRTRVAKLGGTFVVESAPGEGVTIAVALPIP